MANLFSEAITRKELLKFALGEGRYFVDDRSGLGHGEHWVLGSWNASVMDLFDDDKDRCRAGVQSMFRALAGNSAAATATRVWPLIDHLGQFWTQRHAGWLDFDLGQVAEPIAAAVTAERDRCRRGEGEVDLSVIELAITLIQANGGLSELR